MVQQARVLVFETSAQLAFRRLSRLGMTWSSKPPGCAYGNDVTALTTAEYGKVGAVFVVAPQSRKVAQVFETESRLIGTLDGTVLSRSESELGT